MNKTTAKNEIQVILQEYLGNKKAANVAEAVNEAMQTETQHTHNGKKFFINEDSNGALMLTMESMVKEYVKAILSQTLEEDEVQECLEQLMVGSISIEKEMTTEIETISIEGSDSQIYSDLLKYTPTSTAEKIFFEYLEKAVKAKVKPFKVPVCDPSISENGSLQFVAGCVPADGYSYDELKGLASISGVQLGSKNQYVLFSATLIHRLVKEGWAEKDAVYAVCRDSVNLGHYHNSAEAKSKFETTGSRKVVGKCDLANTFKILAKDEEANGFWIVGGNFKCNGDFYPLTSFDFVTSYDYHCEGGVGWFVLN